MRYLLISPLPPARDGIADYAGRLMHALTEAGHDLAAVTPATGAAPAGSCVLGSLSFSPLRMLRLVSATRAWRPDVVHVQHSIATYGAGLLPLWTLVVVLRLLGTPVVVTHHEVTRDIARLRLPGRIYYRLVSRRADTVHVHTARAAAVLVDQLGVRPSRVLTVPHPVYALPQGTVSGAHLRRRHHLDDRCVMLQLGFIHTEKGLRELVEGLATLVARRPDLGDRLRVVVAGGVRPRPPAFGRFERSDRAYLEHVRSRVATAGLDRVVVFTGHVPDAEVAGWFDAADVVLLPYTQSEQSGVANLAVAAGVPVLASRAGGLADLFEGALPTFRDLAPTSVADALEQFLSGGCDRTAVAARYAALMHDADPARLAELIAARLAKGQHREVAA